MGSKRRKQKKRKESGVKSIQGERQEPGARNLSLDVIRGAAILMMIVDHASWLFADAVIEPWGIRFFTRLAMPLFCVLSGYLAVGKKPGLGWAGMRWNRLGQLAFATVLVNLWYFDQFGQFEILAGLLIVHLIVGFVGQVAFWLCLACVLFPWDPSFRWFDFAITVIASSVGLGVLQRRFGDRWAIAVAVGLSVLLMADYTLSNRFRWISDPTVYVLLVQPLAVGAIAWGNHHPKTESSNPCVNGLAWIGRYPLRIYVAQYYALLGLDAFMQA